MTHKGEKIKKVISTGKCEWIRQILGNFSSFHWWKILLFSNRITCKQINIYQMCYVIMSDETIDQNQNADMNKK